MSRVLLLLPSATYRAPDFLDAAAKLGAEVVVASEHRQALSESMGDRSLVVTLGQPERAAAQIAAAGRLDGIVAVDDGGTRAAAFAAERLGLRGNPPAAVERARDKALMRVAFAAAGVRQPDFRVASARDDVTAIATELGGPVVVKPLELSGSRGVIRADDPERAAAAAQRARAIAGDQRATLLVERFVPGPEVAVEGLLRDGRVELLAVFDKPDRLDGPYFEESIYVTPSRLSAEALAAIEATAAAAVKALGLREGPVHAELRVGDGAPVMLELAARSIGGLCSRSLRFGLGISLEELILRHALGMPVGWIQRERRASGVLMLPIPRAGVLRAVRGVEEARELPGVGGVEISVAIGQRVEPLPEGERYLGFVFAKATRPEQVEATLREARALIVAEIEPA